MAVEDWETCRTGEKIEDFPDQVPKSWMHQQNSALKPHKSVAQVVPPSDVLPRKISSEPERKGPNPP